LNCAIKEGLIKKAGSWLQYENMKLGQGMEASKKFLRENPKTARELLKGIKESHKKQE